MKEAWIKKFSDGPGSLTYSSVELKGCHTIGGATLLPIRWRKNGAGPASANPEVFSRHLAGAAGEELVAHARALS